MSSAIGVQSDRAQAYSHFALTALVIFECFLTGPAEVTHVWRRRKTAPSILFLALKYTTLLVQLIDVGKDLVLISRDKDCYIIVMTLYVLEFLRDAAVAAIFALRCIAIWNNNRLVIGGFACLFSALMVVYGINYLGPFSASTDPLVRGCNVVSADFTQEFSLPAGYLLIAFDSVVLVLVVARTASLAREARRLGLRQALSTYVLRDGILYFLAVDALIVLPMVFLGYITKHADNISWKYLVACNIIFAGQPVLSAVVVQRLVLSLRQVAEAQASPDDVSRHLGRLSFAHGAVLGNIGAPLALRGDGESEPDTLREPESPHEKVGDVEAVSPGDGSAHRRSLEIVEFSRS